MPPSPPTWSVSTLPPRATRPPTPRLPPLRPASSDPPPSPSRPKARRPRTPSSHASPTLHAQRLPAPLQPCTLQRGTRSTRPHGGDTARDTAARSPVHGLALLASARWRAIRRFRWHGTGCWTRVTGAGRRLGIATRLGVVPPVESSSARAPPDSAAPSGVRARRPAGLRTSLTVAWNPELTSPRTLLPADFLSRPPSPADAQPPPRPLLTPRTCLRRNARLCRTPTAP